MARASDRSGARPRLDDLLPLGWCARAMLAVLAPVSVLTGVAVAQPSFEVVTQFQTDGNRPYTGLAKGPNGLLYGGTFQGGAHSGPEGGNGLGTVFTLDPAAPGPDYAYSVIRSFAGGTDGLGPISLAKTDNGDLATEADGSFFGLASFGMIFRMAADGTILQRIFVSNELDFTARMMRASDGNYYATTAGGNFGRVIRIAPEDGSVSVVFEFSGTDGWSPVGALVEKNGFLYGTTQYGGLYYAPPAFMGYGTVFRIAMALIDPNRPHGTPEAFELLDSFTPGTTQYPNGLVRTQPDGTLYGTSGGAPALYRVAGDTTIEVVRSINPAAVHVVQAQDGLLYGVTTDNRLFRTDTTGGPVQFLYTLAANGSEGVQLADLIQTSDGTFFGVATEGGSIEGTIFKFSPPDGGGDVHFAVAHNFGRKPREPIAALTLGSDGKLYGTTRMGGKRGWGTVFRLDGDVPTVLASFATQAQHPQASLTEGDPGIFWGMARDGGWVMQINTNGIGSNNDDTPGSIGPERVGLFSLFGSANRNGCNRPTQQFPPGPYASLVKADDGSLFGTTQAWCFSSGSIFHIDPSGNLLGTHTFNAGGNPQSALVSDGNGGFFGTAYDGDGFFAVDTALAVTFLDPFGLDTHRGASPYASPFRDPTDGMLYGTTLYGPDRTGPDGVGYGTLYKRSPTGAALLARALDPAAGEGAYPYGSLIRGPDDRFYGTASAGGTHGQGLVFSVDANLDSFAVVHDFNYADGSNPLSGLILGPDNALYGTTSQGGAQGGGVIYRLVFTPTDTEAPVLTLPSDITVEATSPAGASVAFNASAVDAVDGPRPVTCTPPSGATFPITTTTVTCSASDLTNHTATGTFTVTVQDTTAPVVSFANPSPAPNAAGWNNTDVSIPFSATDATGIATLVPSSPLVLSAEGNAVTGSVTATDNFGHSTTATSPTVKIDKTAPTVTVTTPAVGATYTVGQGVASSYTCTDALSGVATCGGPVANGASIDTASAGAKTFTVNATDSAGNAALQTVSYSVVASGVDLVETTVSNPPAAALPGSNFTVTDTARNQGNAGAGASATRYYLSATPQRDAGTLLLTGSRSVGALAAGATSTGTATVTIPATVPLGTYYFLACADGNGVVNESDESNNCLAAATTLQVTRPDLVETSVSNPPAAALPGSTFPVTDTVANQSLLGAATSTTRYYLSLDPVRDAADVRLGGTRPIPALTPGGTNTGTATVTIPAATALGLYYLLACADDTTSVSESNESNNCLASGTTLQVTRPDIAVTVVGNPPAAIAPGGSFAVSDTTTNRGLVDAGGSTTRYYLSLDQVRDAGDQRLTGTRSVPALPAGISLPGGATVTVPGGMALGTYYLVACADDTGSVTETDETNNCLASTTTIQITRPDLLVTALDNPPAVALPGGTFTVAETTTNQGLLDAGASTTRYYLSTDQARSAGDQRLTGTRGVGPLVAGTGSPGTATVTIPGTTALGAYYLLACADDTGSVAESDEANNCMASATTILVTRPDVRATVVSDPPATAHRGAGFTVQDTVINQGQIAAGTSTTRYYLSADQVHDSGDRRLTGSRNVLGLAAGDSSTGTATVTVPANATLGTYYLLACADDTTTVTETNETNNCVVSAATVTVIP